jgi:hypothetical protein
MKSEATKNRIYFEQIINGYGGYYKVSNLFIEIIKKGIENFNSIRNFVTAIKTPIKHYTTKVAPTIERISEDIFLGRLGYGQLITTDGLLSRYFLSHRNDFYTPYSRKIRSSKIIPDLSKPGSGKVSFELGAYTTQIPVQALPPIRIGDRDIFIYFLYYPTLSSFFLERDTEKEAKLKDSIEVDNILRIEPVHKPILVTSNKDIGNYCEKVVKITGIIKEPEQYISDSFYQKLTFTQREIFENIIRPFNIEPVSFCIDIDDSGIISEREIKTQLPGLIYVESHLENIFQVPNYQKLIGESLPGGMPGMHWAKFGTNDLSWGLSNSNIYVLANNYDRYAFYVESDLIDRKIYESRLKELSFFAKSFIRGIQKVVRNNINLDIKMGYDFLFDFKKAKLFHPDGVLASKEVAKILEETPNLFNTIDWLRRM